MGSKGLFRVTMAEGRQADGAVPNLDMLPEIVDAVGAQGDGHVLILGCRRRRT